MRPRVPGKRPSSRKRPKHLPRPQSHRYSLPASHQQSPSILARSMRLTQVGLPITRCRISLLDMENGGNSDPAAALRKDQLKFQHGMCVTAISFIQKALLQRSLIRPSDDC